MPLKNKNTLLWIVRANRPWLPSLILLTLCHIISACLTVWFALGSKQVIDTAIAGVSGGDSAPFIWACVQQGAICLGIILDGTLISHLRERLSAVMDRQWKRNLLHGLFRGDFADVTKYHTGELLNLINHDVHTLINSILSIVPSMASLVTKLIAVFVVLAALEPLLTVVVLIAGIIIVLITSYMRRKLKNLNKRNSVAMGKVSGFIQESLEKLLMVQAMDILDVMEARADVLLNESFELQRKRKNISVVTHTCMSILGYGSAFGALVWCSSGVLAGTMTFGTMTAITRLVGQLQAPFVNLSGITPQYAALTAAAERLMELEKICNTAPTERQDPAPIYRDMTGIRAQGLCFGYDRDRIFQEADFFLPKGSFGVILGHSGIGKSTLLKLLLGVFPWESGSLTFETEQGAVPIDRTTRRMFAYVPQGNLLLSGTLRDNLLVTNQQATQEEIDRAIYVSAMDLYLDSLPQGLDTVVGENALGLSEGQAQRLSIARAVLSNAPVLLLDEATSALDDETEKLVLSRIRELGKTCIAVTHRAAATEIADWGMELHQGKCTVRPLNVTNSSTK